MNTWAASSPTPTWPLSPPQPYLAPFLSPQPLASYFIDGHLPGRQGKTWEPVGSDIMLFSG